MTRQDILDKVKALNLPTGSYVVFGSCPLALAGLRESSDIDLLISEDVWKQLRDAGWEQVEKASDDKPLTHGVFDAHTNWDFSTYSPTLEQLLETADVVEGVPFASIHEVRKWKHASVRPKDIEDIRLIDEYLTQEEVN